MTGYRALAALHRWSGIVAGALLIVIGITGSALVWRAEIDRWLNPEMLVVEPRGERMSVDALVAGVAARHPETRVRGVVPADDPAHAWTFRLESRRMVHVDPYTGEITGERSRNATGFDRRSIMRLVHAVHHDLMLGAAGHRLLAALGSVWIALTVIGIWLALRQGGRRRLLLELHRSVGLASAVFALVVAFSGVYLAVRPSVAAPAEPAAQDIGFDRAIAAATAALPGSRARSVFVDRGRGHYRVRLANAGIGGDVTTYVAMEDGRLLQRSTGWQRPLHTGEAFGATGEAIVFAVGLLPLALALSGITLWFFHGRRASNLHGSQRVLRIQAGKNG